jgi:hypothetical protein
MTTDIHQPVRTIDNGYSPTIYRALCKYESTDRKEFRKEKQSTAVLTCEACLEKLGVVRCDGGMTP